jgi:hypothetical protein
MGQDTLAHEKILQNKVSTDLMKSIHRSELLARYFQNKVSTDLMKSIHRSSVSEYLARYLVLEV